MVDFLNKGKIDQMFVEPRREIAETFRQHQEYIRAYHHLLGHPSIERDFEVYA